MRDRDSTFDFDDLPKMQAEKHEDPDATQEAPIFSEPPERPASPPSSQPQSSNTAMGVAVLALILAGVAIAFAGVQLNRQSEKLENAEMRVAELENRLSSTDESVSQSSVALQVTIKEMKDRLDELWTQMDKLWASAWRRNQTEIADHGKRLDALTTEQKNYLEQITQLKGEIGKIDIKSSNILTDITVLQAQAEDLVKLKKMVDLQAKTINSLKSEVAVLEKANAALKKENVENAGWIASNNEFRQQTNKSLTRLEQQIKALQPVAPK